MSMFTGRLPTKPSANDAMAWDGTEFRPTRSVTMNPFVAAVSATALAMAIGTGISDTNRIGFLPSTAVQGSESVTLYVGGNAGPTWTARAGVVDKTFVDGGNIIFGTTTGTQHGTAANQKQSFFGATPIVQPTGTTDLRTALINLGLYASGGASPLNLNGGAFTAQSVTVSGLTSGRVPFATTAGLLTDSASLTYNGSTLLTLGDGTGGPAFIINGIAGQSRQLNFRSAGSNRWILICSSTAEAGSDAGSNFVLQALNDAGTAIDNPISIVRATGGAITFTRPLQPSSGAVGAPSYAFSTDATTGLYRQASGVIGHVAAGVEYLRAGIGQLTYSRNTSTTMGTAPITSIGTVSIHAADGAACSLAISAYGNQAGLFFRQANGTAASQTATVLNGTLGIIQNAGYNTTTTPGYTATRNTWVIGASEAYTDVAQGFYQDFYTVASGAIAVTRRLRIDASGSILIGTTTDGMTAAGSLAIAQDLAHRGTKLGLFNTAPIVQKTGYGTPTGNAYQASFAAGSITLPNLAAAVAQLILDLKAYGQIGT